MIDLLDEFYIMVWSLKWAQDESKRIKLDRVQLFPPNVEILFVFFTVLVCFSIRLVVFLHPLIFPLLFSASRSSLTLSSLLRWRKVCDLVSVIGWWDVKSVLEKVLIYDSCEAYGSDYPSYSWQFAWNWYACMNNSNCARKATFFLLPELLCFRHRCCEADHSCVYWLFFRVNSSDLWTVWP